jgi:hypothetical protein
MCDTLCSDLCSLLSPWRMLPPQARSLTRPGSRDSRALRDAGDTATTGLGGSRPPTVTSTGACFVSSCGPCLGCVLCSSRCLDGELLDVHHTPPTRLLSRSMQACCPLYTSRLDDLRSMGGFV